jgi:hypothetical protein
MSATPPVPPAQRKGSLTRKGSLRQSSQST